MKIIDLTPEYEKLYFCCLEDWSDDMADAGGHKECWYNKVKDRGLRVKLARDDSGAIAGMIQYIPIELSHIEGKDLYVVLCIWVHGYKNKGVGNFQKRGIGKALLKAAEEDVKNLGSKGLVTWGLALPFFMRASWFKKQGYSVVDKESFMRLLWKPFLDGISPPKFIKQKKQPELLPGKVNVSLFLTGWCPAQNIAYERTKRAAKDFADKIEVHEYSTLENSVKKEWGLSDAIFVDSKQIRTGPPPTYKKIRRIVEKKVSRIH